MAQTWHGSVSSIVEKAVYAGFGKGGSRFRASGRNVARQNWQVRPQELNGVADLGGNIVDWPVAVDWPDHTRNYKMDLERTNFRATNEGILPSCGIALASLRAPLRIRKSSVGSASMQRPDDSVIRESN